MQISTDSKTMYSRSSSVRSAVDNPVYCPTSNGGMRRPLPAEPSAGIDPIYENPDELQCKYNVNGLVPNGK